MTLNEKAELDALVNFFDGRSWLIREHEKSPVQISLVRKGMIRWGRVRHGMREHIATKKGIATAHRFKKDWSRIWGDNKAAPNTFPEALAG